MRIRNGDTPIQLPEVIRSGDPISAKWANSIRTALQRLRDRVPVIKAGGNSTYRHPWEIITTIIEDELRIYVSFGIITYQIWNEDESQFVFNDGQVYFSQTPSLTYLLNDPFIAGDVGYFVASVSTDYGVWIKVARNAEFSVNIPPGNSEPYSGIAVQGYIHSSEILVSTEFVEFHETPTYDDDYAFIYIGKVSYDEDGIATVTQYRRSDIVTGIATYPVGFTIASADAGNSITEGSDGGAFYEAPPP